MSTPLVRTHTDAILTRLRDDAGLTVGDAVGTQNPNATGDYLTPPYSVLYKITGGTLDGPLDAPEDDGELTYQVTSVGFTREQAEAQADLVRTALISSLLVVDNREIQRVVPDPPAGVMRDDDATPPRFWVPDRFRLLSTPA